MTKYLYFILLCFSIRTYAEVYKITGSPSYPPVSWKSNQQTLEGIGVDLAGQLFKSLHYEYNIFYSGPWKRVQKLAEDGQVDFLVGLHKTAERLAYLEYLEPPYLKDKVVIFYRKDSRIKTLEDLYDKTGAGLIGDAGIASFKEYLSKKNVKYKKFLYDVPDIESVFKLLESNRVQYTVYGLNAGLSYMTSKSKKDIAIMETPFPEREIYFAIPKKSKLINKKKELEAQYSSILRKTDLSKMVKTHLDIWAKNSVQEKK